MYKLGALSRKPTRIMRHDAALDAVGIVTTTGYMFFVILELIISLYECDKKKIIKEAEASSGFFRLTNLQGFQTDDMKKMCRGRAALSYSHEPPSLPCHEHVLPS
ncbi:hypothetical protein HDV57DRAFT_318298 [Trichoderma longibrachiatum]|uniref:Uncharacterized protein n=1 Tax=Trichoderma longibrachiatum ATCC 18648 TaxID=983965 RepID=A0A2T4BWE7_TRILO|nr:hypothetical protein M440DRAFT_1067121 [Trichoderma longibrachiatum ATCC 18648]